MYMYIFASHDIILHEHGVSKKGPHHCHYSSCHHFLSKCSPSVITIFLMALSPLSLYANGCCHHPHCQMLSKLKTSVPWYQDAHCQPSLFISALVSPSHISHVHTDLNSNWFRRYSKYFISLLSCHFFADFQCMVSFYISIC